MDVSELIKKNFHPLKLAAFAVAGLGMLINAKINEHEVNAAIDKAVSNQIDEAVDRRMSDVSHLQRERWGK